MLAKDRVVVVVSKLGITGYRLWSRLSYTATASNRRRIVEIQLWATVGLKRGCQPFSCRCSDNVTHCRKEMYATHLSKESMPFVKSKHPVPTRSLRFLRAVAPSTSFALCLHHAHPYVAAEEKNQSHGEKQRVWSRSCGLQEVWQCTDCSPMWLLQSTFLASVVWKRGCQPFSCRRSLNDTHCPKEICSTCLSEMSKESIPAISFGIFNHPLPPEAGSWEPQCVPPALHYACIMLAQDPMPLSKILDLSLMQKSIIGLVTELWSPRFLTENWNVLFTICQVDY